MRTIHLANPSARDATVAIETRKPPAGHKLGVPGKNVRKLRLVAGSEGTDHQTLAARFGDAYGAALVAGDPDVDLEQFGRQVTSTTTVLTTASGEVIHASPRLEEWIEGPDGQVKERREPVDRESNVTAEVPVTWARQRIPIQDAVRQFVFGRTLQVRHVDGLTFDFLFAMAKELAEKRELARLVAGPNRRDPLIFQLNGTPWQAFLGGRVDGERYQLLLHLTNLELKRLPTETSP
jgi:hypothetical protein